MYLIKGQEIIFYLNYRLNYIQEHNGTKIWIKNEKDKDIQNKNIENTENEDKEDYQFEEEERIPFDKPL